jgi:glucokinase
MNGPVCSCGNIGCLEIYGNFMNLISEYRLKKKKTLDDLGSISNREAIKELEMIWYEANNGDEDALEVIEKLSNILGIGAVSLTNIFSPEFIIVSTNDVGTINVAMITEHIQRYVKRYAFSVVAERVKVIPSKFGNDIHLFGAAALVLQELFSLEHFFQETWRIK